MDGPSIHRAAVLEMPPAHRVPKDSALPGRGALYLIEGLASAGTNLLVSGIYFYMTSRYGWGLLENFLLASGQGVVYIIGALSAHKIADRLGNRGTLVLMYALMSALAITCLAANAPVAVAGLLLAYTGLSVITWPILEGLVSAGLDSRAMSRRIARYNLVWAAVGVFMLAINGTIILRWPAGVFVIPAIVHIAGLILVFYRIPARAQPDDTGALHAHAHPPQIEPELLKMRTLALWLSRLALPATYVMIFGLMSLMPSLPALKQLDTSEQTAISSIWMFSRWATFLVLGLTTWWHTRPRVLLAATAVMLIAYLGVTIRPSDLLGDGTFGGDLLSLALWQIVLGISVGLIYFASLYFGMVLSQGSTEHGGYHEALIGLGMVLGPGAGAVAQKVHPGSSSGIGAVAIVVALSAAAVFIAPVIQARRRTRAND